MPEDESTSSCWLMRPAIQWINDEAQMSCSYWDEELISITRQLSAASLHVNLDEAHVDRLAVKTISYESLFLASVLLARELRKLLSELPVQAKFGPQEIGIPVAVAIPEGPFLPLSILAVHMLNEPSSTTPTPFAILVPLEPCEGNERILHMLNDSRPALILSMSGDDWDRLETSVSKISVCDETTMVDGVHRPRCPILLDLKGLLLRSIKDDGDIGRADLLSRLQIAVDEKRCDSVGHLQLLREIEGMPQSSSRTDDDFDKKPNRVSHIVYTSGTSGIPKGCISSVRSLRSYLKAKNVAHKIGRDSTVLLASALSFDPCLSDSLSAIDAGATLAIAPRKAVLQSLPALLAGLEVTHVLCTPTLWSMVHNTGLSPDDFPLLRVVALGGEPIPDRVVRAWARERPCDDIEPPRSLRMCSTYGVTEACVYQTFGEVFASDQVSSSTGQDAGYPLEGLRVIICAEDASGESMERSANVDQGQVVGEIVLSGSQVDKYSRYLNRPELTGPKFVSFDRSLSLKAYRTGDRGYIDATTGRLHVLGRIDGEEGMVKVNGVRVELGEIESVLVDHEVDDRKHIVVADCVAAATTAGNGCDSKTTILAFCVLGESCCRELGIWSHPKLKSGVLVTAGPLYVLLRTRARDRIKAGAMPAAFVLLSILPMSPTGKRDRRRLPSLDQCEPLDSIQGSNGYGPAVLLCEYGSCGSTVSRHIIDCLNLQPCQQPLVTTSADFGMLGGDSLAATRVVRSLYAFHHEVRDTRFLGGEYGQLEGAFAVTQLLRAMCLGDYVDMLDRHGVCKPKGEDTPILVVQPPNGATMASTSRLASLDDSETDDEMSLYHSLLEATTINQAAIAMALLDVGVDPNLGAHGGRLSKTSSRMERKQSFCANPLHLACNHGRCDLVAKLIDNGCRFNSPDATGSFPMHLAASGTSTQRDFDADALSSSGSSQKNQDDLDRLECVKLLLDAGAPLAMKDGNKQTVLHSAARAGHCRLIDFLMDRWRDAMVRKEIQGYGKQYKGGKFDWLDRWCRTPVHWAVLNGHVEALRVLIRGGCSPNPPKTKAIRSTSVATESPMDICVRLHGVEGIGADMAEILSFSAS